MIGFLKGKIIKRSIDSIIVDVNGVGYKVFTPLSSLCNINENNLIVELYIETIVKEDSITLYGFLTEDEKKIFNQLLKVSKVGPKLAIAILSGLDKDNIISAINEKNIKLLSSIPGVGKKTAERICFDLKDKFQLIDKEPKEENKADLTTNNKHDDVIAALTSLGYKTSEIKGIVEKIVSKYPEENIENILKIVLNELYNG